MTSDEKIVYVYNKKRDNIVHNPRIYRKTSFHFFLNEYCQGIIIKNDHWLKKCSYLHDFFWKIFFFFHELSKKGECCCCTDKHCSTNIRSIFEDWFKRFLWTIFMCASSSSSQKIESSFWIHEWYTSSENNSRNNHSDKKNSIHNEEKEI